MCRCQTALTESDSGAIAERATGRTMRLHASGVAQLSMRELLESKRVYGFAVVQWRRRGVRSHVALGHEQL